MEVIIWTPSYLNLASISQTLNENPLADPPMLNEFKVQIRETPVSDVKFLWQFSWEVIKAGIRPQVHIVLLDGNIINRDNWEMISQQCACAAQTVSCQPMKYVAFYDLNNCTLQALSDYVPLVRYKIKNFITQLSSFARLQIHQGQIVQFPDSGMLFDRAGLVELAKNLVQLVYHVLRQLND